MKVGDTIVIPKGTLVFDYTGAYVGETSKRVSRGTIKNLFTLSWVDFVDHRFSDRWMRMGISNRWPLPGNMPVVHPEVIAEKARIDAMLGSDYRFVTWGDRFAHVAAVQPAEAPKGKEAAISKRTMMVKGSRWRFNQDVTITGMASPDRDHRLGQELASWTAAGRPYDYNDPFRHYHEVSIFTIRAGTEFTVTDNKLSTVSMQKSGLAVRTDLRDDQVEFHIKHLRGDGSTGGRGMPGWQYWGENPWWNGELCLPYRQIEDVVDALEVPETLIYLLKDSVTGKYFADFHDDYSDPRNPVFSFKMVDTVKSAKKYAKPSNAQASIMSWTGYMEGMEVTSETFSATKKADLPDTWELVSVNKITLAEGAAIDIQSWYRDLIRLRALTLQYGSGVRNLFKKIEGSDEFTAILAIKARAHWDVGDSLLKEIDDEAKNLAGPLLRSKGQSSLGIACSYKDGIQMAMIFSGRTDLEVGLYDVKTLESLVPR